MKKKFISLWDSAMLKKRFIIETVNDQLKNISYIEHSRAGVELLADVDKTKPLIRPMAWCDLK